MKQAGYMAMSFSTKEYFVKETYKSIRRNGFMSFASISTVAVSLLVLGMFLLIFLNTNNLAQYLEVRYRCRSICRIMLLRRS